MERTEGGTFFRGAGLVWKWQRLVWWIFAVNLIFALFATHGMVDRLSQALDHSSASRYFVHGFDIAQLGVLSSQPDSPLTTDTSAPVHFSMVFMIFMLFLTGGILATYLRDERPRTGTFFEACGFHFWRFFRLLIYMLIVFLPVGGLVMLASVMYNRIDERSISPFPAVHFFEASAIIILFLFIVIRIWFDMAQVIAVADDEKRMHRALRRAFGLLWHNFFSLLWLYLRVSIIAWIFIGLGLRVWMFGLAPESNVAAFLLSQLMVVVWIATRLWQRASESLWYRRHAASSVPEPVWTPAPVLASVAVSELYVPPAS
jgi:hypothetical protein